MVLDEPPGSVRAEVMMSIDERQVAEELVEPSPKGEARAESVDVIRGVALMGILAMNIVAFGWPGAVYSIPIMAPDYDKADLILWGFNHLVFDTKMMTLFSMLFGAGLVLMSDRAEGRGHVGQEGSAGRRRAGAGAGRG